MQYCASVPRWTPRHPGTTTRMLPALRQVPRCAGPLRTQCVLRSPVYRLVHWTKLLLALLAETGPSTCAPSEIRVPSSAPNKKDPCGVSFGAADGTPLRAARLAAHEPPASRDRSGRSASFAGSTCAPSEIRVPSAAPNKKDPCGVSFGAADGTRTHDNWNHNPVL